MIEEKLLKFAELIRDGKATNQERLGFLEAIHSKLVEISALLKSE